MIIFQFKFAVLNYVRQIVKENLMFRFTKVSHWTRFPVSLHFSQKNKSEFVNVYFSNRFVFQVVGYQHVFLQQMDMDPFGKGV